jgi:hypothetical protein
MTSPRRGGIFFLFLLARALENARIPFSSMQQKLTSRVCNAESSKYMISESISIPKLPMYVYDRLITDIGAGERAFGSIKFGIEALNEL